MECLRCFVITASLVSECTETAEHAKKMPSDIQQVGNGQKNHEHNWSFFLLYSSSL